MKLPEKLVEIVSNKIVDGMSKEGLLEAEDPEIFKKKIISIFKKAQEEEKALDERTKEVLRENLELLEKEGIDYGTAFKAIKARLAEEMNINVNRRERMNQIANMIMDLIMQDETVEIYDDPPVIRRRVLAILREAVAEKEDIDRKVRRRIKEYSPHIVEGTPEWNLLYRRMYEDELRQRGLA